MRKSQAALEFLTTYAWAFVIIGVTISALYYFGALDFSKYLPQKCVFPSQFKCVDFGLDPSSVKLRPEINCAPGEFDWIHSTEKDIEFSSCSGGGYTADTRVELKVSMVYYAVNTPSKPLHAVNGKINGRVTT